MGASLPPSNAVVFFETSIKYLIQVIYSTLTSCCSCFHCNKASRKSIASMVESTNNTRRVVYQAFPNVRITSGFAIAILKSLFMLNSSKTSCKWFNSWHECVLPSNADQSYTGISIGNEQPDSKQCCSLSTNNDTLGDFRIFQWWLNISSMVTVY